jgi:hypothetical protein
MIVWVLAQNPYRRFYEHSGGVVMRRRTEPHLGTHLPEFGYGWKDVRTPTLLQSGLRAVETGPRWARCASAGPPYVLDRVNPEVPSDLLGSMALSDGVQLGHVNIEVTDLARARRFYDKFVPVLGFTYVPSARSMVSHDLLHRPLSAPHSLIRVRYAR